MCWVHAVPLIAQASEAFMKRDVPDFSVAIGSSARVVERVEAVPDL